MAKNKSSLTISLDEDVLEGIRDLAEYDGRNLSQYINLVLSEHIKTLEQKDLLAGDHKL